MEDYLSGTTGTGKFNTGFPDTVIIDPLPHDRQYFADHLSFLEHYYGTASKGELTFSSKDIYPAGEQAAYTLDFPMWHYNFNTDTALLNQRLVELFAQTVRLASADVDFTQYDAIVIFHAGVGKDFNVGFDNTPFDIPSAYISQNDLLRFGGALPAGVTRGLLLPEGQNQDETLGLGVELSLNGVMIKLFGNWLGMPDLYNTETGASGIGRWGMMDQGSGNVNALVPAFPDAWSRVFMGWSDVEVLHPSGNGDTIRVARIGSDDGTEIVRIPLNGDEYYLLENRNSDADSIGYVSLYDRENRELRINREGEMAVEPGFKSAVRASHYDFGIPGSGILIWHINEEVISESYAENRVNANPGNRGVRLVEADGSQDIGREYGFATAGSGSELGLQEDCWYRDNRPHREANGGTAFVRFNNNTHPPARTHDHSYTFLSIERFSDIAEVMTAVVGNSITMDGFPSVRSGSEEIAWALADVNADGRREICFQSADTLYAMSEDSGAQYVYSFGQNSNSRLYQNRTPIDLNGNSTDELWFILDNDSLGYIESRDGNVLVTKSALPVQGLPIQKLLFLTTGERKVVAVRGLESSLFPELSVIYDADLNLIHEQSGAWGEFRGVSNLSNQVVDHILFWREQDGLMIEVSDSFEVKWSIQLSNSLKPTMVFSGGVPDLYFPNYGYVDFVNGELLCPDQECIEPQVDWDQDGQVDGGGVNGANYTPRENFPFEVLGIDEVFDLNFDGAPDVLQRHESTRDNGMVISTRLLAYNHDTSLFSDFPLVTPGKCTVVSLDSSERRYYTVTEAIADSSSVLSLIRLPITPEGNIVRRFVDAENGIIFLGEPRPQVHDRENFAYVWPNPASDIANVRLTFPHPVDVVVHVYDLTGRQVAELQASTQVAGQFDLQWNTHNVQSGVYIARVEAIGGGRALSSELKVAVIR